MRSATPASTQASRAIAVYSSLTSQHSRCPPGARPRAMQIDENPVNVPTSTAWRAPTRRVSSVSRAPWSALICIRGGPAERARAVLQLAAAPRRAGAVRAAMYAEIAGGQQARSVRVSGHGPTVPWPRWPRRSAGATLYERVGGAPFFERLVDAFYDGVADDEVLLRLYPEAPDLTGARHRLRAVPDPVLGRPDDVLRRAWPPPAADAPHAVPHRAGGARPLARRT